MSIPPIKYNDLWFRIIVCLLSAHFLVMVGEKVDTLEALTIPSYYPTLLINYIIALLIAFAVKKVTVSLDKTLRWENDLLRRLILQFVFGVFAVSVLSFALVFIYFISFGQDILASTYPAYEFPFSVVLILCLNFFYVTFYFYQLRRESHLSGQLEDKDFSMQVVHNIVDELHQRDKKEILIIDMATRSIPVRISELAFTFVDSGATFVMLKSMQRLQDAYVVNSTLKDLEQSLDGDRFFRINRKCIVNFDVIRAYKSGQDRSLVLILEPDITKWIGMEQQDLIRICTVSADRVSAFKRWIDR